MTQDVGSSPATPSCVKAGRRAARVSCAVIYKYKYTYTLAHINNAGKRQSPRRGETGEHQGGTKLIRRGGRSSCRRPRIAKQGQCPAPCWCRSAEHGHSLPSVKRAAAASITSRRHETQGPQIALFLPHPAPERGGRAVHRGAASFQGVTHSAHRAREKIFGQAVRQKRNESDKHGGAIRIKNAAGIVFRCCCATARRRKEPLRPAVTTVPIAFPATLVVRNYITKTDGFPERYTHHFGANTTSAH